MTTGYYLLDHPPRRSQHRRPRRAAERGVVVVHTAENAPDFAAFDGGAEAVARFIRDRPDPGSYHELVDSDSPVPLLPDEVEAFGDGTGSNAWAWHVSIATRADVWPWAPQAWRDGAVEQAARAAARYARRLRARTDIVIPARRISRAESEAGVPGFVAHADRDPDRRSDPGTAFPWPAFLARFAELTDQTEDDDMPPTLLIRGDASHQWWFTDGLTKRYCATVEEAGQHAYCGLTRWNNGGPFVVPQSMVDELPDLEHRLAELAVLAGADTDAAEVARLVIEGLGTADLTAAQAAAIVDAIEVLPPAVADELDRRARARLG